MKTKNSDTEAEYKKFAKETLENIYSAVEPKNIQNYIESIPLTHMSTKYDLGKFIFIFIIYKQIIKF